MHTALDTVMATARTEALARAAAEQRRLDRPRPAAGRLRFRWRRAA